MLGALAAQLRAGAADGEALVVEQRPDLAHHQHVVREEDFVARFGGDEFVVILPELNTDKPQAEAGIVAEKIRTAPDKP